MGAASAARSVIEVYFAFPQPIMLLCSGLKTSVTICQVLKVIIVRQHRAAWAMPTQSCN